MLEEFNPYHQWLGLDRQIRRPDAYQLLSLSRGEMDPARITAAADMAIKRVRGNSPGSRAAEWSRLLAEIDAAKRSLLGPANAGSASVPAKTAPAASTKSYRPAPRSHVAPANPEVPTDPASGPAAAAPVRAPGGPVAPRVPMAAPVRPGGGGAAGSADVPVAIPVTASSAPVPISGGRTKSSSRVRRARRSNSLVAFAATAGALMLVVAVVLLVVVILRTRDDDRRSPARTAVSTAPSPRTTPPVGPATGDSPLRPPPTIPHAAPVVPAPGTPAEPVAAPGVISETPDPSEPVEPTEIPAMFGQDAIGDPPASSPEDVAPVAAPADPDPPVAQPLEPEPATDPLPASAASDPASLGSAPTPQEIEQLSRALTDARSALEDHRFEDALAILAKLERLPMLPEHARKYQRLRLLVQYARNFRTTLVDAMSSFQGGDDIPVGNSTVVGVVQADPDRITVKVAGANRTYPIDDLPAGLAIAIAEQRLAGSDPVSLVLKAAYLASVKNPSDEQLAKAREWFGEAKRKSVDIGDLDEVLNDKGSYALTP